MEIRPAPLTSAHHAGAPTGAARVMVRGTRLSRVYARGTSRPVRALDDATVSFAAGALTAVMGPSGSGKSTLMHLLAGLDRPDEGSVEIDGVQLGALEDRELTAVRRRRMGFVFQSFNLMPSLSAAENIRLPLSFERGRDRIPGSALVDWERHLVERLGIAALLDQRPAQLSGGEQQRVAIARALLTRPAVVFADEPTGNLDLGTGHDVLRLLHDLAADDDTAVVMVTHDPVAAAQADRLVFVRDGRLVDEAGRLDAADISRRMLALTASRPVSP